MWSYTLRRLLATIPTLLAVITVCYILVHAAPGGPFDSDRKVSEAVLANLQAKYHLDLPPWQAIPVLPEQPAARRPRRLVPLRRLVGQRPGRGRAAGVAVHRRSVDR